NRGSDACGLNDRTPARLAAPPACVAGIPPACGSDRNDPSRNHPTVPNSEAALASFNLVVLSRLFAFTGPKHAGHAILVSVLDRLSPLLLQRSNNGSEIRLSRR